MSGVGTTNDIDRQIVAESIINRNNSGLYGDTYSDILTSKQYNAVATSAYANPYVYMSNIKSESPYFYKKNEAAIKHNFVNAIKVSYRAYNNIGASIGGGVVSYVSPPLKSTHFDNDPYLTNITNTITGLEGISGVWKRK